jgi:hypothetical protein
VPWVVKILWLGEDISGGIQRGGILARPDGAAIARVGKHVFVLCVQLRAKHMLDPDMPPDQLSPPTVAAQLYSESTVVGATQHPIASQSPKGRILQPS